MGLGEAREEGKDKQGSRPDGLKHISEEETPVSNNTDNKITLKRPL